jgi:hypothetical protein
VKARHSKKGGVKMKFEAIVKKEKMSEYLDERSPFNKLLERTCKQLRKNYRNYYSRNRPLPNYYKEWDVCQARFGISNVSKKAFPKLMRIFGEYIDHIVTLKKHEHSWKLCKWDGVYVWMRCADCDADLQLPLTEHLSIIRRLVLSKRDSFRFETEEEERITKQFFKYYPETLQKSKEKLVKRQEKLLEQNPKSPEVSKLKREIEKLHLFALICKE